MKGITLSEHILREEALHQKTSGEFTRLLYDILFAAKVISREVNKAGLVEILGLTGHKNVQGEDVQKLDEFANETIINALARTGHLAVMASEEVEGPIPVPPDAEPGHYALLFDPLDGSGNIDTNASIGTIFSILRVIDPGDEMKNLLQPGHAQVCAGYVLYGSSTVFVYTTGHGVHGFTLDPSVGEFLLSHPNIRMPEKNTILSVNEANFHKFDEPIQRYLRWTLEDDKPTGRPYSRRYIGALVADFHRNLLRGGTFLYPAVSGKGKLRLLYEANPLAFIAEQAGGYASTGAQRMLDVTPEKLHMRVPLLIGVKGEVERIERFVRCEEG